MRIVLNGEAYEIDAHAARARLGGHPPEPIQTHWVEMDGQRWPPKQALEVILGVQRAAFTTYRASDILRRIGLVTSREEASRGPTPRRLPTTEAILVPNGHSRENLPTAVEHLAGFMDRLPLTTRVAGIEHALLHSDKESVVAIAHDHDIDLATLTSALTVRRAFGRVNDVIHALVITLALPRILESGETLTVRPSLAAGNDPSRKFDLETSLRVAEFKVSAWAGADAMRKRGVFVDLVHVALDGTRQVRLRPRRRAHTIPRKQHLNGRLGIREEVRTSA